MSTGEREQGRDGRREGEELCLDCQEIARRFLSLFVNSFLLRPPSLPPSLLPFLNPAVARQPSATILRSLSDNDMREQEVEDDEDEDEDEDEQGQDHDEEKGDKDEEEMKGKRKEEGGRAGGKNGGVLHLHVLPDVPLEGQPASADEDPLYF